MKKSLITCGISILLTLSGCSSLKGKAQDFMEQGAYGEAVNYYQMAVDKDPSDAEARAGLAAARAKYVDTKLIETRMARLAGNSQQAIDLLLDVVLKEKAWAFAPAGQVTGTQDEETAEALRFLDLKSSQSAAQDKPVVGLYFFRHYKPIFESIPGAYAASFRKIEPAGKALCTKLSKARESSRPYFSQFVQKLCAQWGQETKDLSQVNREIAKRLYSGIHIRFGIEGLEAGLKSETDSALQTAFRQTPWFNSAAPKRVLLRLDGRFRVDHTRQDQNLVHHYNVTEPYTAYVPVKKTRNIPVSDFQTKCFYDSQNQYQCGKESVTNYRQEEYTETEPRTQYREVPHTFPYTATYHRQALDLSIDGKVEFPAEVQSIGLQDKAEKSGYEHAHNRPEIGLKPSDPGLLESNAWYRERLKTLTEKFRAAATNYWSALYCQPEAGTASLAATGERVQQCLANPEAGSPSFTEQWYQTHFGIRLSEAREIGI